MPAFSRRAATEDRPTVLDLSFKRLPLGDDLVAGRFRLVIDHVCREALAQHLYAAGFLDPADDVGRKFARAVSK